MSDIDCQERYNGMMRCRCKDIKDCCYADKCERHKWLRRDIKLDGYYVCQRPRNEAVDDDKEPDQQD